MMIYNSKSIFLFLFVCLFINVVFAQQPGFSLDFRVKGIKDGTRFFLIRNNGDHADTVQRVIARDGLFHFEGRVPVEAECYFIKMQNSDPYVTILLDNKKIKVNGELKDWPNLKVTGSPSHANYLEILNKIQQPRARIDSTENLIAQAMKTSDSVAVKQLRTEWETARINYIENWKKVINDYPDSYYTPALISILNDFDNNQKRDAYKKLTEKAKNSKYGIDLKNLLVASDITGKIAIGNYIPPLKSKSIDGKIFSVNEFVNGNKLTLIDFWASWCVPCREEVPYMKKVYNDFKAKGFNILSISLDDSEKSWKAAIEKEDLIWSHASELKGLQETMAKIFAVNGIPASLLVDSKGIIVALDLPGSKIPSEVHSLRREELYKKVKDFFGK